MPAQPDSATVLVTLMGQFVGFIITVAITVSVAAIAYRQLVTARRKLNLDLFDRRMQVYRIVRDFLNHCQAVGTNFDKEEVQKFWRETDEVEFLFGTEVAKFVENIKDALLDVSYKQSQFRNYPESELRTKLEIAATQSVFPLYEAREHLKSVFSPYLSFAEIKSV